MLAAFANAQVATSVTLTPSQNPSPFGQQVTLTAAVSSGATGKVTFYDGVNVLGTSTITGSQATFTTELLPWARGTCGRITWGMQPTHRATRQW